MRRAPDEGSAQVNGTRKRVLIVGAGETGHLIAAEMLERSEEFQVIGFLDDDPQREGLSEVPILGTTDDIQAVLRQYAIDEIVIAYVPTWYQSLLTHLASNGGAHPEVKVVPRLYEAMIGKVRFTQMHEIPLISLNGAHTSRWVQLSRRINDLLLAGVMLLVCSPLMALAALAIRLTSRGPVILKQERVGKGGKPFLMYKFRTMWVDAEARTGPVLARPDDERCTPVGCLLRATKIDEMPQFLNVLKGEMSMVGPRPERPVFVRKFEREVPAYALRHSVKPGITGLAQINAGYLVSVYDKLKYDLMYVFNQSVWLDWKIFLLTPMRMLFNLKRI